MTSGMKQLRDFVGLRIDPRQVRTLVQIAIDAGKSKVVEVVRPTVNLWNDVVDVKSYPSQDFNGNWL